MKFYIERPYRDKNIFDVMYDEHKLGEGSDLIKIVEFEKTSFVNEIAGSVVCTENIIEDAAKWCREQGYKTYTQSNGWDKEDK